MKEDTPPFTHDLTGLAQKTELYDLMSEQQKDFIEDLNPLNIEALILIFSGFVTGCFISMMPIYYFHRDFLE